MRSFLVVMFLALSGGCGPMDDFEVRRFEEVEPAQPNCLPEHLRYCQPATGRCWDVCTCVNSSLPCP